jgi:hypothetical protein
MYKNVIPALRSLRQEDAKFKSSLVHTERPYLKKKKTLKNGTPGCAQ